MAKDLATLIGHLLPLSHKASGITFSPTAPLTSTDVQAAIDEVYAAIAGGGTPYTDEQAQDAAAAMIQNGTGISWSYNDGANTLTPTVSLAAFSTTNLSEGSNLYFTDERAQDAVGGILTDSASVDFTYNDGANTITAVVLPAGVDHNSLANLTTGDPHTQYTKDPGTVVDKEITLWSGTGGRDFVVSSGIQIGGSTAKQIAPTGVNENLLLDGNGTGFVQLNTGANSQQFPKSRPAMTGVLSINAVTGQMSWIATSTFGIPVDNVSGPPTLTTTTNALVRWGVGNAGTNGGNVVLDTGIIVDNSNNMSGILGLTATGALSASNFSGSHSGTSSGTNTGDVTIGTANGLSLIAQALSLALSSTSTTGALSNTDWNTFNGKQPAGNYITALTTDVVAAGPGSVAATIQANVVSNAKLAQMPTVTIKGNNTGGTANALDLTVAQVNTMLGTVVGPGSATDTALVVWDGVTGKLVKNSVALLTSGGALSGLTQLDIDNLRLDANTLSSTSGALILSAAATGIQMSSAVEMAANILKFGASNEASITYATSLVINPKVSGAADVVIGSSAASGGNDADLRISKLGLLGSDISSTAVVNLVATGAARQALNFNITYTGSGNSNASVVAVTTDQGTNASLTNTNIISQYILNTTTHTTVTSSGIYSQQGINAAQAMSTGTYTFHGLRSAVSAFGVGGSHSGGTFRRYGLFQDAITALGGTPGTDLIMGAFFNNSINLVANNKIIFDSTSTALGDSSVEYNSTDVGIRITVDGTIAAKLTPTALGLIAGTSTTYAKVGGVIDVNTTAVGNVLTGEDDLITYSVPANAMAVNGDSIEFEMSGTFAANVNAKRIRVKYGGTTMLDTTGLAINGGNWLVFGRIIRTGAATQAYYIEVSTDNALLVALAKTGTAAETLSGAVTLKCTGEATLTDDVSQKTNHVRYCPNE